MTTNTSISLFSDTPLTLDSGEQLGPIEVAYTQVGALSDARDNAVLVCHALTGDQYVASPHPITRKPGWWDRVIGADKLLDTNRFSVICSNVLGSCLGTTGPASINPKTGEPYGLDFPVITIRDMVRVQKALIEALGIKKLALVIGGSMGGMQVLEWMATYPEALDHAVILAASAKHSAQNIALHEIGRQAIMADVNWQDGRYYKSGNLPTRGLAVARMTAHVSYLSEDALARKFGRGLQDRDRVTFGFEADFQVESYLRYQGNSFTDRFDANSYLYITRALDYLDIAARHDGRLAEAFKDAAHIKSCVLSFTSDWLYPTSESRAIVHAFTAAGIPVSFAEIKSDAGHDAFLLDVPEMDAMLGAFIRQIKLAASGGSST